MYHAQSKIQYANLKHPWSYHYYIDCSPTTIIPLPLKDYLITMSHSCPDDKFLSGPRSSSLNIPSKVSTIPVKYHPVCSWAKKGLEWGMQGTGHGNVQLFMLKHDSQTIGVEVPIWLDEEEYKLLGLTFESKGALSGHIDILQMVDDTIWVWDYKPNAHREKHADTQTLLYAMMLSYRTNIPIERFSCGYFDQDNCYVFKPKDSPLTTTLRELQLSQSTNS
ncbi:MAG: PD-(D/E)XK nuclease family protein [Nanobdellota archaeon]